VIRVLLLADTHLGFDWLRRPRSDRPRRGADFFANFERALQPARSGDVDLVVHAGDLLYRSRVPAELVRRALEPLLQVADLGVPVILVPGNHERSNLPYPLFGLHEHLHVFHRPGTVHLSLRGAEAAIVGIPCLRDAAARTFGEALAAADDGAAADLRLLVIHQAVEGATVGPADFVFCDGDDVVAGAAIPRGFAAVLAGHIHRHQVLTHDLRGRPLPAPVLYPGSVERTSFAERHEEKGYVIAQLEPDAARGGRLSSWRFVRLPSRPMVTLRLATAGRDATQLEGALARRLCDFPADTLVRVDLDDTGAGPAPARPSGARLRRAISPEMIVTFRHAGQDASRRPR